MCSPVVYLYPKASETLNDAFLFCHLFLKRGEGPIAKMLHTPNLLSVTKVNCVASHLYTATSAKAQKAYFNQQSISSLYLLYIFSTLADRLG